MDSGVIRMSNQQNDIYYEAKEEAQQDKETEQETLTRHQLWWNRQVRKAEAKERGAKNVSQT